MVSLKIVIVFFQLLYVSVDIAISILNISLEFKYFELICSVHYNIRYYLVFD